MRITVTGRRECPWEKEIMLSKLCAYLRYKKRMIPNAGADRL